LGEIVVDRALVEVRCEPEGFVVSGHAEHVRAGVGQEIIVIVREDGGACLMQELAIILGGPIIGRDLLR
jgi:hypothetical protein